MISRCVKSRKRYITLIKKRRLHLEFGEPDKNQKSTDKRKKGQPLFPDLTEAECQVRSQL